jgi:hypothetical protein
MSTNAPDADAPDWDGTDERYAALRLADDAVVIYDQSNHRAWVQSSETVALEDAD